MKKSAPVLEDSDIERIMSETSDETKHCSSTYKWDIWKERYPKKEEVAPSTG